MGVCRGENHTIICFMQTFFNTLTPMLNTLTPPITFPGGPGGP